MSVRLSTGLRNKVMDVSCVRNLLRGGVIHIYSGTQPTTADLTESGTLLAVITDTKGTYAGATAASATIVVTGTSGTFDSVLIGGAFELLGDAVTYATSTDNTATLLAAEINETANSLGVSASVSSSTVTLTFPAWMGATANDATLTVTTTTMTSTDDATFSGGVDPTNGLTLSVDAASGVLSKGDETWQGTGVATGTAGYFRWYDANYVTGADSTSARMDGSCGTSGTQLIMTSTSVVTDVDTTVDTVTFTEPAS